MPVKYMIKVVPGAAANQGQKGVKQISCRAAVIMEIES